MPSSHNVGKQGRHSVQMIAAIAATIVVAAVIFGGGAYLFTKIFTGSFQSLEDKETIVLEPSEYKSTIDVSGSIKATVGVSVSPEVDGTVKKVEVKDGSKVKEGDVLFTMTNKTLVRTAETAKESYDKAKQAQSKAQSAYDKATNNVKKAKQRLKDAKEDARILAEEDEDDETASASSDFEFDSTPYDTAIETAEDSQKTAKEALDTAKETTRTARENYESAQAQLDQLTVKAERAGTIADMAIEEGVTTSAINTTGAAMRIVDLDSLMGMVKIPEGSIGSIAVGQDCAVTIGSGSDTFQANATVYKIADTPDKKKEDTDETVYSVQLTLDTLSEKVRDGMSIVAKIELRDYGTVYYVPTGAVAENDTGAYVEVVYNDKTVKEHGVTVLDTTDDGQAVIQGNTLSKDMKIVKDIS